MRKPTIKSLQKKLTKAVHEAVFRRDESCCQKCGKYVEGSNRHPSHVIPKSRGNILRWDMLNIKTMCFHHHINWWHKEPTESGEWFKQKFPERHKYLEENKRKKVHWKIEDYQKMLEELT